MLSGVASPLGLCLEVNIHNRLWHGENRHPLPCQPPAVCGLPEPVDWGMYYVGFVPELSYLRGCDFFSPLQFSYPYAIFKVMISNTREMCKVLIRLSLSLSCVSKGRRVLGSALLLGSVFKGRCSLCVRGKWQHPALGRCCEILCGHRHL